MIMLAMALGFGLGSACTIIAVGIVISQLMGKKTSDEKEEVAINNETIAKEGLQKQWENFLNYEGSEKGQMGLGDEK